MDPIIEDLKENLEDVINALIATSKVKEDYARSIIGLALTQLYISLESLNKITNEVL